MPSRLDRLEVRLCGDLPFDLTIYEKKGLCEKPSEECNYCNKLDGGTSLCNKKTYTPAQNLNFVF